MRRRVRTDAGREIRSVGSWPPFQKESYNKSSSYIPSFNIELRPQFVVRSWGLVSNTICFESNTLFMYQNVTNYLGSGQNISIENLSDKILKYFLISYVTCKLRVLCETDP